MPFYFSEADTHTPIEPEVTPGPEPISTGGISTDGPSKQRIVEESIKSEGLDTLSERAIRFLEVQGIQIVLDGPFAVPSKECAKQFRDGYYYGCIALSQTITEAIIRHVWQVKLNKKQSQEGDFEKNVEALHKKGLLSDEWQTRLDQMWSHRHSFHHLKHSVERDCRKLEALARGNLKLLSELEQLFFAYSVHDGIYVPAYPELWLISGDKAEVFIKGRE